VDHPIPRFQRPRSFWQIEPSGRGRLGGGLEWLREGFQVGAVTTSRAAGLDIGEDVGEGGRGRWDVLRLSEEKRWLLYVGWYVIGPP